MNVDDELDNWGKQWRSQQHSVPTDLVQRVEKQTTAMRDYRRLEKLVTVFVGGGTVVLALVFTSVHTVLLAVGTWVFLALAWAFALRHTKGLWEPNAPTTAAYVDLSIRRCRWKIADSRYDSVQAFLLTAFVFILDDQWLTDLGAWDRTAVGRTAFWVLGLIVAASFVVVFERNRRRAKAELKSLMAIQQQSAEAPDSGRGGKQEQS